MQSGHKLLIHVTAAEAIG